MAHNTRLRERWRSWDIPTPSEWETLDDRQEESINADDGGTWDPAAIITIGGAGFRVDGTSSWPDVSSLTLSGFERVKLAARSVTRLQHGHAYVESGASWVLAASRTLAWSQAIVDSKPLLIPLWIPHNAVLTSVDVRLDPNAGHSFLPFNMPVLSVRRESVLGVDEQLGAKTDTQSTVSAYETRHALVVSGLSHTVDRNGYRYYARLSGEYGTNSVTGLLYICTFVTYTSTVIDED